MAIQNLMTDRVDTKRMTEVQDGEEYQSHLVNMPCAIQQERPESASQEDGYMYNRFRLYCDINRDIQTGDIVIHGTDEYRVRGVSDYRLGGRMKHKMAIMVKNNAYT